MERRRNGTMGGRKYGWRDGRENGRKEGGRKVSKERDVNMQVRE